MDFPSNRMVSVSGSDVDLGKPADFPSYGWDNEYGERRVNVPDFQASENVRGLQCEFGCYIFCS